MKKVSSFNSICFSLWGQFSCACLYFIMAIVKMIWNRWYVFSIITELVKKETVSKVVKEEAMNITVLGYHNLFICENSKPGVTLLVAFTTFLWVHSMYSFWLFRRSCSASIYEDLFKNWKSLHGHIPPFNQQQIHFQ